MLSNSLRLVIAEMKGKMWEQSKWKILLNPGEYKTLVFWHPKKKLGEGCAKELGFI
jgi:hypothetical protein